MSESVYIAIDLKSFFASVECVERGLDPLSTNLVVADSSRTEKTVCLAVSPSLKAYGIAGRARLFEVIQRVGQVNRLRRCQQYSHRLTGKSVFDNELKAHSDWEVDYITATPRMKLYIEYSRRAYASYLKYISPDDIHIYSIDEVFIHATPYLRTLRTDAHGLARLLIREVLQDTGITATAGIGTNLYLAKVAMDIVAKHIPADADGVRIAELDEQTYRRRLWAYRPISKFWRVGRGIAQRLEKHGIYTMGDIARQSVQNEALLYKLFGVNAELLIDHAWGWEPCTIEQIHAYRPRAKSLSRGQVLHEPYTFEKARVVMQEMAYAMSLTLLDKHLLSDQMVISVGYDKESISLPIFSQVYHGEIVVDHYGRSVPKPAHASANLEEPTSSASQITQAVMAVFDKEVNKYLLIRRMNLSANHLIDEDDKQKQKRAVPVQLDLFTDYDELRRQKEETQKQLQKERRVQEAILQIKKTYGKNSILTGLNFAEGATMRDRNSQIGGHKA